MIAAISVRSFERRLDKFWGKSELVYDYTAHIATGHKFNNNEELELEADDSLLPEEDGNIIALRPGSRILDPDIFPPSKIHPMAVANGESSLVGLINRFQFTSKQTTKPF